MAKGPKFTKFEPDDPAYKILDELVGKFHPHLSEARIALVWGHGMKPDRDGHVTWGQTKKVGPLEQQFNAFDFVIVLNETVWNELAKTPNGQQALLDHELCHCGSRTNDEGEVSYNILKHDLEEFVPVVRRHGLWRSSVECMVKAALEKKDAEDKAKKIAGIS